MLSPSRCRQHAVRDFPGLRVRVAGLGKRECPGARNPPAAVEGEQVGLLNVRRRAQGSEAGQRGVAGGSLRSDATPPQQLARMQPRRSEYLHRVVGLLA
eukprot:scaffold707_cov399-Prasinococcus_capsulatus_cf.AAC.41